jgi:hypothetical protein
MMGEAHIANREWEAAHVELREADFGPKDINAYKRLMLMAIAQKKLGNDAQALESVRAARRWAQANKDRLAESTDRYDVESVDRFYRECVGELDHINASPTSGEAEVESQHAQ